VENLERVLAFLREGVEQGEKTVVHCAGGSGRSGHVLAAWLVHSRGLEPHEALATVRRTGRNPYEAVEQGSADEAALVALLDSQIR
jgi:protein-tyrosine phosphatase